MPGEFNHLLRMWAVRSHVGALNLNGQRSHQRHPMVVGSPLLRRVYRAQRLAAPRTPRTPRRVTARFAPGRAQRSRASQRLDEHRTPQCKEGDAVNQRGVE